MGALSRQPRAAWADPPQAPVSWGLFVSRPMKAKKNPSPAGDGWYCTIMQRALRPRNSPPLSVMSPGRRLRH